MDGWMDGWMDGLIDWVSECFTPYRQYFRHLHHVGEVFFHKVKTMPDVIWSRGVAWVISI